MIVTIDGQAVTWINTYDETPATSKVVIMAAVTS